MTKPKLPRILLLLSFSEYMPADNSKKLRELWDAGCLFKAYGMSSYVCVSDKTWLEDNFDSVILHDAETKITCMLY